MREHARRFRALPTGLANFYLSLHLPFAFSLTFIPFTSRPSSLALSSPLRSELQFRLKRKMGHGERARKRDIQRETPLEYSISLAEIVHLSLHSSLLPVSTGSLLSNRGRLQHARKLCSVTREDVLIVF